MSTDREAVVWTRLGGTPRRMGRLYVTDRECRFTYDDEFLDTGLPGLGIVYAPEFFGKTTIVRQRSELFDLPGPAEHDTHVRGAVTYGSTDAGTDRRVVDRLRRMGPLVDGKCQRHQAGPSCSVAVSATGLRAGRVRRSVSMTFDAVAR